MLLKLHYVFSRLNLVQKRENIFWIIGVKKNVIQLFGAKTSLFMILFIMAKKKLVLIGDNLVLDRNKFGAKPEKFQEIFGAKSI